MCKNLQALDEPTWTKTRWINLSFEEWCINQSPTCTLLIFKIRSSIQFYRNATIHTLHFLNKYISNSTLHHFIWIKKPIVLKAIKLVDTTVIWKWIICSSLISCTPTAIVCSYLSHHFTVSSLHLPFLFMFSLSSHTKLQ